MDAAFNAGAGGMGNYTHTTFVSKGIGQWKPGMETHPAIGTVGTISHVAEVKIEMHCPEEKAKMVKAAIKNVHPYEEPAIEFIKIEEII